MAVRAIRGATCLDVDGAEHMRSRVVELITTLLERNKIGVDALISMVFTATPDIHSDFPATAARGIGLDDVPLLCAQELDIAGALQRVIRVMAHAEMHVDRADVVHVYLQGAEVLRRDLAQ